MFLLTSAYLAPIHYYTKLFSGERIVEERADHYVKQTYRNRCIIAADDGPLALTIPVVTEATGTSQTCMRDIRISEHGKWRHQHWQAIVSAYDRSAFFEYYADDFLAVFNRDYRFLVLDLLEYHPDVCVNNGPYLDAEALRPTSKEPVHDFRQSIRPKLPYDTDPAFHPVPYFQVFGLRHGFLPNLSIIDLLFNMGPESRLVLRHSIRGAQNT